MAAETVHLVVRSVDDGFYATSPQAPGLAYGRATLPELRAGVADVLAFHLGRPGPYEVIEHLEQHFDVGGRELVTRVALDDHRDGRLDAAARLVRALSVPDQADVLLSGPTNRVGEVLYVCVVPSDRLGWIAAQLDPAGERATLAVAVGDELLLTFRTSTVAGGPVETRDTVADLMRTQPIVAPLTVPVAV